MKIFRKFAVGSLAIALTFGMSGVVLAATTVGLGTANNFAILAGSGITNTGSTTINGDVGTFPTTTETGFGSMTINGTNHAGDGVTQGAKNDLVTAYNSAAGQSPDTLVSADLGGQTLTPGTYRDNGAPASLSINGTLTLNGGGNSNAVFIFQSASTLVTGSGSNVVLTNGAQSCNVFWQLGSSATLGTSSHLVGTVIALTSATLTTGATVEGRILARNGAVTLDTNTITRGSCFISGSLINTSGANQGIVSNALNLSMIVLAGGLIAIISKNLLDKRTQRSEITTSI